MMELDIPNMCFFISLIVMLFEVQILLCYFIYLFIYYNLGLNYIGVVMKLSIVEEENKVEIIILDNN